MVRSVITRRFEAVFQLEDAAEMTVVCEALDVLAGAWQCTFEKGYSLTKVCSAILELFGLEEPEVNSVEFTFAGSEVVICREQITNKKNQQAGRNLLLMHVADQICN